MKDRNWDRATILVAFAISAFILIGMTGCAPMTEQERLDAEYKRVEYLETQFLPMVQACRSRAGAFLYYEGGNNRRMRQHMEKQQWHLLSLMQLRSVRCTTGIRQF